MKKTVGEIVRTTPGWQDLRKTLKGTWSESNRSDWPIAINKLRAFLGPKPTYERLICVKNYIDALSRGGIIYPELTSLRSEIVGKLKWSPKYNESKRSDQ
jgi:hypothetical protein